MGSWKFYNAKLENSFDAFGNGGVDENLAATYEGKGVY